MSTLCRAIAYYLPQYHPIPENDVWWGKGFTEWTNTARAKPLFPGHYQPHIPADLGFYDLRVPETRIAQAEMAHSYGIEGFCYYHYWFGGKRLLERPFNEVLRSVEPDFPFCLCWANESWSGRWHGADGKILIEQIYLGKEDEERHFYTLLPAFYDKRYLKVEGKPIFLVYRPEHLPNPKNFTDHWRNLASKNNLNGLYIIGVGNEPWKSEYNGFDAATTQKPLHPAALGQNIFTRKLRKLYRILLKYPKEIYSYQSILHHLVMPEAVKDNVHPSVIPNWDNSPRSGLNGVVFHDSTPELFKIHLHETLNQILHKPIEKRLLFIKSWNEWAEGNHLEPDLKFGRSWLEVIKEEVCSNSENMMHLTLEKN